MFPDVEPRTLRMVLESQGWSVQASATFLLDSPPPPSSGGAAAARIFPNLAKHPRFIPEMMSNPTMLGLVVQEVRVVRPCAHLYAVQSHLDRSDPSMCVLVTRRSWASYRRTRATLCS